MVTIQPASAGWIFSVPSIEELARDARVHQVKPGGFPRVPLDDDSAAGHGRLHEFNPEICKPKPEVVIPWRVRGVALAQGERYHGSAQAMGVATGGYPHAQREACVNHREVTPSIRRGRVALGLPRRPGCPRAQDRGHFWEALDHRGPHRLRGPVAPGVDLLYPRRARQPRAAAPPAQEFQPVVQS
jgi:hypothetical protein